MIFSHVYDKDQEPGNQGNSLKRYCAAFDKAMDFFGLQETIEDVEETYLVPYIGRDFYEEVQAAYDAGLVAGSVEDLIRKFQSSIAYFVLFQTITTRGLHMSDMGPGELVSSEGTYLFSRQWRTKDGLRKAYQVAMQRMDRALAFLDANIADFPTYKSDSIYAESKSLFINNAFELGRFMPADSGRIVYLQLRSSIAEAELRYILPTLGGAFFTEMKLAIQNAADTALTPDQVELIDRIRMALLYWARLRAIPNLRLRINESGLVEPDFESGVDSKQHRPAREETVRSLWISLQEAGQEFLTDLQSWLNLNAEKFPTYQASDRYVAPEDSDPFNDTFHQEGGGVVSLL